MRAVSLDHRQKTGLVTKPYLKMYLLVCENGILTLNPANFVFHGVHFKAKICIGVVNLHRENSQSYRKPFSAVIVGEICFSC